MLGCSPAWQNAGGACSSYLVDAGATRLLIDCGNGAFGALRAHCDYASVDAVAITHTHGDHVLDLLPFCYALLYSPRAHRGELRRPRLLLPPGAYERLCAIFDLIDRAELIDLAFEVETYDAADPTTVGDLTLTFAEVPHFVPTHAIGVAAAGGGRMVFGADSRPCQEIVDFARDASVLVLEATLPEPEAGVRGHLTSSEAAQIARDAGASALVLTHLTDELPRDELLAAAQAIHPTVSLAVPQAVHPF